MDKDDAAPAPPADSPAAARSPKAITRVVVIGLLAGACAAAAYGAVRLRHIPIPAFWMPAAQTGTLTVETQPAADVLVDGERRGTTPLTFELAPGTHTITIKSDGDERVVPLTIAAGAQVTQHFEMKPKESGSRLGRVSVVTDPPGARITIDGQPRGVSPLVIADVTAEEHNVTVANETASAERKIVVTPAGTASVMFTLASKPSGPVGGWLSVSSPFDVELAENNDVIGSVAAARSTRIMLSAGRHDLVLTGPSVGYQKSHRVDVAPGKTTILRVEPPPASVSVNARPWAEVLVDGASIGQTPIANAPVALGSHEVIFRNPQLGERRQTVLVTANGPNRVAVDLTK
ncbi:MAG TPA: PEGA domain-containing protein [Vicinamibacterales bacterium]|nr:PEGA domain-containing protein [Vicinamibacterales bacterium]